MLNNSSREADDMQLYLGYGGAWVLSLPELVQPKKKEKMNPGITLQAEQGKRKKEKEKK